MKKIILTVFFMFSIFTFSQEGLLRKISVTGNSEREVSPDTAKISFYIESKKESLNSATKDANEKMNKFKGELNRKKINISSFETISFYSTKERDFENEENNSGSSRKPSSYNVEITFSIMNTEFDKISSIINTSEDLLKSVKRDYETNSFYFSLNETEKDMETALSKVTKKLDTLRKTLSAAGIHENNVKLKSHKISEIYTNDKAVPKNVFKVVHSFTVELKDLKKLNELISLADDSSVNITGSVQFDISDKEKIESEMYNEAFKQAENKAVSILKSSGMKLGVPLVVSEDIAFQQKMIDRIDENWTLKAAPLLAEESFDIYSRSEAGYAKKTVDYTPKPIRLSQNISVMYEIK